MKRIVPVQQAVGMILCHDITEVVPGRFKGRAFKKGHVVCREDIPRLLNLGKENLYALSLEPGLVHEDDTREENSPFGLGAVARLFSQDDAMFFQHAHRVVKLFEGA